VAARLVVGLALVVIAWGAPRAAVAAMLLPAAVKVARAVARWVNREFIQQWRLALALLPFWAALVWLATH
jgi:hypothetical protein